MLNIDEKQFARAMLALEQDPQPIHLELGKTEAWSLLSTIQLASRHPIPSPTVDRAVQVIKRYEGAIAQGDEVLEEVILAGWEGRSPNHSQHSAAAAMKAASSDIKLIITKYEAYCFFGAIQLAFRHPEYKHSLAADRCEGLARELQRAITSVSFANAPLGLLAEVLEMGWDESADVEQNSCELRGDLEDWDDEEKGGDAGTGSGILASRAEEIDYGTCCACGIEDKTVRNIGCLHKVAPIPGTGWGCVVCGLPSNGAIVIVCDRCMEEEAELKFAVNGYVEDKQRIPISELGDTPFDHDQSKHGSDR